MGENPATGAGGCPGAGSSHPPSPRPPPWRRRAAGFGRVQVRRGQRRGRRKDAVGGSNRRGPVLPSGRAGCSGQPRSPLGLGLLRDGPGTDTGLRSRRCHRGAERGGRWDGKERSGRHSEEYCEYFFSPPSRRWLLPNAPRSAGRASPAGTAAASPSRDGAAGLGSARSRLRAKEGFGKVTRG